MFTKVIYRYTPVSSSLVSPHEDTLVLFPDVYAAYFGVGCENVRDSVLSTNPDSMDIEHPIEIRRYKQHNVDRESAIYINVPNEK